MLTLLFVFGSSAAATAQLQLAPVRAAGIANVLDFPGADPTGASDSASAINSALATGKDVYLPGGSYVIGSEWIKMTTPNQSFFCDGPSTTITVAKAPFGAHGATPALVIYPDAKGARFEGCTIDHNGAQFTGNFPKVPLRALNRRQGSDAFNAALGTTVLVMADYAQINGTHVKRGWNVCIGFGVFDLSTGLQSAGPRGASYSNGTTSECGQGHLTGRPDYREGAGVDNFTGLGIRITNSVDFNSQVGVYLDTGASSTILDTFVSYNAQISPHIAGTWQNTIGGDALWIGSQNRLYNGQTWGSPKGPTIVNNFYAFQPMRHCVFGFWSATGAILNNIQCMQPGLEGVRMEGGMNKLSNVWIDQPNWLRGNNTVAPGTPAEQTNAVQINANSAPYLAPLYWNTDIVIDGLNVTAGEKAHYAYTIGMEASGANRPKLKVTAGNQLASGLLGLVTGNSAFNLNVSGKARAWQPQIFGSKTMGAPRYGDRSGQYWQMEDTTYLTFNVSITTLGGADGNLAIGNLPIAPGGKSPDVGQCWISGVNGYKFGDNYSMLGAQIGPSSTVAQILESGSNVPLRQAPIANVDGANLRLMGGCVYHQ